MEEKQRLEQERLERVEYDLLSTNNKEDLIQMILQERKATRQYMRDTIENKKVTHQKVIDLFQLTRID